MPGFGEADKPKDFPYTIEGYAAHLGGALEQLGVRAGAHRRPRLRRALGAALGGRQPGRLREHDAGRHRDPLRLQLACAGEDLAPARGRRAVLQADDPLRDALGAEARPAATASRRSLRALLQGEQGQGHAAGDPAPLPRQPAERARTARRSAARARTGRRWSSGARTTPTSRSSTPSARRQTFPDAEVVARGKRPLADVGRAGGDGGGDRPFLAKQLARLSARLGVKLELVLADAHVVAWLETAARSAATTPISLSRLSR